MCEILSPSEFIADTKGNQIANFGIFSVQGLCTPENSGEFSHIIVTVIHRKRYVDIMLPLTAHSLSAAICKRLTTARIYAKSHQPYIDALIIDMLPLDPTTRDAVYFDRAGLYCLPGTGWCYATCDEVINAGALDYKLNPAMPRLLRDPSLGKVQCVSELIIRLQKHPGSLPVVWSYVLLSYLRSAVESRHTTFFSLFLQGNPEIGKTTMARLFGILMGDINGNIIDETDAISTDRSLKRILHSVYDRPFLIDDLAQSSNRVDMQRRLNTVSSVLRHVANRSSRTSLSGSSINVDSCHCGAIFTGEYGLSVSSDRSRVLTVPLTEIFRPEDDMDRTLAATSLHHFLHWLMPQMDEALAVLDCAMAETTKEEKSRLGATKLLSTWAWHLFLSFASEIGVISAAAKDDQFELFRIHLDSLCREQSSVRCDPIYAIALHYSLDKFHVISKQKFEKEVKNGSAKSLCCKDGNTLLVSLTHLCSIANQSSDAPEITDKQLGKLLRAERITPESKDGHTASRRIAGQRLVPIDTNRLIAYATQLESTPSCYM